MNVYVGQTTDLDDVESLCRTLGYELDVIESLCDYDSNSLESVARGVEGRDCGSIMCVRYEKETSLRAKRRSESIYVYGYKK